jgi:lipopolysaccharide export LptBFGC system permease protein LptF
MATRNKDEIFFYEVKTKPKMRCYTAQGINIKHYNDYKRLLNKIDISFYLYFIDNLNGDVHSVALNKLIKLTENNQVEYQDKNVIAWNLKHLKFLFTLTNEQINSFKIE